MLFMGEPILILMEGSLVLWYILIHRARANIPAFCTSWAAVTSHKGMVLEMLNGLSVLLFRLFRLFFLLAVLFWLRPGWCIASG